MCSMRPRCCSRLLPSSLTGVCHAAASSSDDRFTTGSETGGLFILTTAEFSAAEEEAAVARFPDVLQSNHRRVRSITEVNERWWFRLNRETCGKHSTVSSFRSSQLLRVRLDKPQQCLYSALSSIIQLGLPAERSGG